MKKFKLSAILASVLSLGIICSGSVFASSSEEEIKIKSESRENFVSELIGRNKVLKSKLDRRLGGLYDLSLKWPKKTMRFFRRNGFLKLQIDTDSFIERFINENEDEYEDENKKEKIKFSDNIAAVKNLSEYLELNDEYRVMSDIESICKEIKENTETINLYSIKVY